MMTDLHVGQNFSSFSEFEQYLSSYENENFVKFCKRNSRKIDSAVRSGKTNVKLNPYLIYYEIRYNCVRGGVFRAKGTGQRKRSCCKIECPAHISLRASADGKSLEVKSFDNTHNHEVSKLLWWIQRVSPTVVNVMFRILDISSDEFYSDSCSESGDNDMSSALRNQKSNVRQKAARIKLSQRKTGSGTPTMEELSPSEERILKIIGSETAVGDENIEEGAFEVISVANDSNNQTNGINGEMETCALNSGGPSTSFFNHTPTSFRQQPIIKPLTSTPCNKDTEKVPKRRKLEGGSSSSSMQKEILDQITEQTLAIKEFKKSFCNKMDQLIEIGQTIAKILMSNNNV